MTPEETICEFMESKPTCSIDEWRSQNPEDAWGERRYPLWWLWSIPGEWIPCISRCRSLDALREVEERITGDGTFENTGGQWGLYRQELMHLTNADGRYLVKSLIHATAEQKIAALAAVIGRKA